MSIDLAQQHLRAGQYAEALTVLATLGDEPLVMFHRWQAKSALNDPAALPYARALALNPLPPEQHLLLFNWALQNKHHQLVVDLGRPYIGQRLGDFQFLLQLGYSAKDVRQQHLAFTCLHQAAVLAETDLQRGTASAVLGMTAKDYGQTALAMQYFQSAYKLAPSADSLGNLLMTGQYAQTDITQYYAQAEDWRQFSDCPRVQHALDRQQPDRVQKGLRIGLISGDFINHSLTPLLFELIRAIPQNSAHTLYFYHNRPELAPDAATTAYKQLAAGWTNITDMTVDQVVLQILQDEVDVLIDLAGHTAMNRLDVMARRPAPVQIGWVCGMMTPCAIETVPYFLADRGMLTPHIRETCPEVLIDLPTAYVYFPLSEWPLNTTCPADRLQTIQFGSLNNPCKVGPQVLDVWARVLQRVPNSVLHLKVSDGDSAQFFRSELNRRGVPLSRAVFVGHQASNIDIQRYYAEKLDIALDPWPCSGMLTTLEAWWNGVPTVTLAGETFVHNQSASVLTHLGETDLICRSIDQYVERAVALAADKQRRRAIRTACRTRLDQTIVRQPIDAAKAVINGIEACWTDWCVSRQKLAARLA